MTDRPKFDPDKAVEYVAGEAVLPARILATDLVGRYPIAVAFLENGEEYTGRATADGRLGDGDYLRNRMIRREGWVRVYRIGGDSRHVVNLIYDGEDAAYTDRPAAMAGVPFAVARIEWEEPA